MLSACKRYINRQLCLSIMCISQHSNSRDRQCSTEYWYCCLPSDCINGFCRYVYEYKCTSSCAALCCVVTKPLYFFCFSYFSFSSFFSSYYYCYSLPPPVLVLILALAFCSVPVPVHLLHPSNPSVPFPLF